MRRIQVSRSACMVVKFHVALGRTRGLAEWNLRATRGSEIGSAEPRAAGFQLRRVVEDDKIARRARRELARGLWTVSPARSTEFLAA